jgi:hypothetical protein
MLARSAGQWWEQLRQTSDLMEDALYPAEVHAIEPLPSDLPLREQAFREAAEDISAHLHLVRGLPVADWPALCHSAAIPDLSQPGYESMMRLQMSALVGLLQAGPYPEPADSQTRHAEVLMRHERRYWRLSADANTRLERYTDSTLANAVTISTLFGAADENQAMAVLARVPGLRDKDEEDLNEVNGWLHTLYPEPAGGWGALEPDLLGEYLVGTRLGELTDLLDEPLSAAAPEQVHRAFHLLARASGDHPHLGRLLKERVLAQLIRYGPTALGVATETEQPDYLIAALEEAVAAAASDVAALTALAGSFPSRAPALSDLAERLMQLAITVYGRLVAEGEANYRQDLAKAWEQLSDHLSALQRPDDALAARTNALDLYRELAGRGEPPDVEAP